MGVLVSGVESVSEGSSPLPPLSLSTPPSQSQLIALLSAVLGAATKPVGLIMDCDLLNYLLSSAKVIAQFSDGLLPILRQLSCYSEHSPTSQHAVHCYASVVNKLPQGEACQEINQLTILKHFAGSCLSFLDKQLSEMWSELNSSESPPFTKLRILNLLVWVCKALLMRGHSNGMDAAVKVEPANALLCVYTDALY